MRPLSPASVPCQKLSLRMQRAWKIELDIRTIKQTLNVDHVRGKTPERVRRELWVTLLAYNLIRKVIATAAAAHGKPTASGLYLGLPDDLVVLDAAVDGIVFRLPCDVHHDGSAHRRQRSGRPTRTDRTARFEASPTPLPADATPTRSTARRTRENVNP